jgi:methylated-DNA-[protein]-cysteine S-methyltransferase
MKKIAEPVSYFHECIETPLGVIIVFADTTHVVAIEFRDEIERNNPNPLTKRCVKELLAFFEGKLSKFSVPFSFHGTPFQKKVWYAIHAIPFGKTKTYGELAKKIGNPKAVRAVGTATGKNPLCILVPCHRVLPADGSIGNYASGPAKKAFLLTLEHRQS